MKKTIWFSLLTLAVAARAAAASSTNSPAADTNAPPAAKTEAATIPDASHKPVFITNTVPIAGQRVTYVAETGMLPILKSDGTSRASVFYVAYTRQDKSEIGNRKSEMEQRPVTFCFNGGRFIVRVAAPRRLWPAPGEDERGRHAAGAALGWWTTSIPFWTGAIWCSLIRWPRVSAARQRMKRPTSFSATRPISIRSANSSGFGRRGTTAGSRRNIFAAKSYGVFRAAGLANHLRSRYGMYLNGLILVSGVLDFSTIWNDPGNNVPLPALFAGVHGRGAFPQKTAPGFAIRSARGPRRGARLCQGRIHRRLAAGRGTACG